MLMSEESVAIITGAARGIGLATAWTLARQGARVVIADRDAAVGEGAAQALSSAGHRATAVEVDVSRRESVQRLVEQVLSQEGRIDVLVNNAGIAGRAAPLLEVTDADWDEMMAVDLKSIYLCCQAVLPDMLARRS